MGVENMSILGSILFFAGSSTASGITWDILKTSGKKLINSFRKRFAEKNFFNNENESEECMRRLATEECISKNNPYASAGLVYQDLSLNNSDKFIPELERWIMENKNEFENIMSINKQSGMIKINKQVNMGSGKIINAGVYNEFS